MLISSKRKHTQLLPALLLVLLSSGLILLSNISTTVRAKRAAALQQKDSPPPETKVAPNTNPELSALIYSGPPAPASRPNAPKLATVATTGKEVEPNNTSATATPLTGSAVKIRGSIFYPAPPAATTDVDFYSFTATMGDRIYAATQTLFDASASGDSVLDLLNTDGTTVIENDPNDGTFNASSSSIAGALIPANGTYFLRVRHNVATGSIRPYDLHFNRLSGAPTAEVEPNETPATATPLSASGWASGTITAVSPGEADFYSLSLNAGDSVYLSLDMNPERDAAVWNGRLGFGLFGNPPANQILLANDANAGAAPADPNSEAFFFTVKDAGTYFVYVDSIVAAGLGANATYNLAVSVIPRPTACTTYTSTNVPQTIPTGPGMVSSTITVPGNPRIADLDVSINLNHTFMQDLDVHLVSPAGNDNGLFTDIGAATTGGAQTLMDVIFDDEAALPFAFAMSASWISQPELAYRLSWFDGEDAGGTWTLVLRDDATGDGGTLNSWSITVCTQPPAPTCGAGLVQQTVFSTDFESGAAGFTHSGAQDEWELGLPTFTPITTCNSGVNCWKTDLDNTYNASSSQDLVSPNINLAGLSGPVRMNWAMRYHLESANFDHMWVEARQVGMPSNAVRVFDWTDATMNNTVGNPAVTINESAGWGQFSADISALAGQNIELVFHVDSDTTVQLAGLAIDDVSVTACRQLMADLSITKTDGVTSAVPGGSVTYTITASNAGPDGVSSATVADTFPGILTATWTCVGAGGGTCTAAGAGNISDTVNLPAGGSVTYTVSATISASATGTLSNTATVSSSVTDPTPGNNSATDTDTLTPQANLGITKTDGVTTAVPGQSVTYTITASNAGPSNAPGATIADTFPAVLTATWTCVGAGGGTCTAAGSGNISDTVNLPAGGSVTYTVSATISASATGTLSNTATVAAPGGVTDPTPGNNSATDTDTLTPQANLGITKTDGVTSVTAGNSVTYTIVASNAGPSNAPGSTVADTFPATLTGVTWTCVGAGGGTCTAAGSGNINDTVNLPVGGSVTYTATGTLSLSATGTLANTATVATAGGVTDPVPGNNSATDTDTIVSCAGLTCPANITVPNASGACNAVVTYSAPTTSGTCGTVTCTPASGSTFAVGVTTVTCSSSIGAQSCTFTVTVQDTQAPTLAACPANQSATSPGGSPVAVTYTAPMATDNCPGATVTCVPASGSNFAVGTTTVTCTASDTSPNSPDTTCSFTVTVSSFTPVLSESLSNPLGATAPGDVINGTASVPNNSSSPQTGTVTLNLPAKLIGLPGTCVANFGTCTINAATVVWNGTIPAATPLRENVASKAAASVLTINYQAQVANNAIAGEQLCVPGTAVFNGQTATATACITVSLAQAGPGLPFGNDNVVSDQKPGSVLFYNLVSSSATNAATQNSRISLTNTNPSRTAFVHLFFVDGSNCTVADSYICLTPNQTATLLHSDVDPGTTGYLVAVATDRAGCPISFNYLIGDEYVKLSSGHAANLAAESIAARAGGATFCAPTASDAVLAFNDVAYDAVPRVLALDNFASPADGNQTLLVVNRVGGFLSTGAFTTGTLFGILYDDAEQALSFSLPGACQVRANLNGSTIRTTPRVEQFVPTGRTGWLKLFNNGNDFGLFGASLTFNANANTQAGAFNQGHNLHKLRLSQAAVYTIPIFPPSC